MLRKIALRQKKVVVVVVVVVVVIPVTNVAKLVTMQGIAQMNQQELAWAMCLVIDVEKKVTWHEHAQALIQNATNATKPVILQEIALKRLWKVIAKYSFPSWCRQHSVI